MQFYDDTEQDYDDVPDFAPDFMSAAVAWMMIIGVGFVLFTLGVVAGVKFG